MLLPAVEDVENAAHHSHRVSHTSHSVRRYCFNTKRPTDSAEEAKKSEE